MPARFGFVVHPLTAGQRRLLGLRSADLKLAFTGKTTRPAPRVISELSLRDPLGGACTGRLVAIPHLPEALLSDQEAGVEAVLQAVRRLAEGGAQVVGLGALTAVIGGQGKHIAAEAPCAVTTGNALTAWAAVETVARLEQVVGPQKLGLMGPPGPVANAILGLLLSRGRAVEVVAPRAPAPLLKLIARLNGQTHGRATVVESPDGALGPGAVLIAASATGGRLKRSELKPGSLVIDVAQPLDVVRDGPERADVLLLDGEYVRLPAPLGGSGWRRIYGWVTGQGRHLFACFVEPMVLSLSGRLDLATVGRDLPLERVKALGQLAAAHGFSVDGLHHDGVRVEPAAILAFVRAT